MKRNEQPTRSRYAGPIRNLVVAIDIGTTFSAASIGILQPYLAPKFEEILRWPKQANPDAKIPSVVYYDEKGAARVFGAETDDPDTMDEVDDNGWDRFEWWKLYLRPAYLPAITGLQERLPVLRGSITVDKIFTDFLGYIRIQVQAHLTSSHGNGERLWRELSPNMSVVLTTPNGWEGKHQHRMRMAAIAAGLATKGTQVQFVTEAEATVLYTAASGKIDDWLAKGEHIVVCDCGGGTIDITGYNVLQTNPLRLEEVSHPRCYLAGAIFVNHKAEVYLREQLKDTEFIGESNFRRIMQNFERNAKRNFSGTNEFMAVELGGSKNDPKRGIMHGRLKIPKDKMLSFFAESIQVLIDGLDDAIITGKKCANKVVLGGGLTNSPHVLAEVGTWAMSLGVEISRPTGPLEKAVTTGALLWHSNSAVTGRVTKFHYGTDTSFPYNPTHMAGRETYIDVTGQVKVNDVWYSIVHKDMNVTTGKEYTAWFHRPFTDNDNFNFSMDLFAYRWGAPPMFIRPPKKKTLLDGFLHICEVRADLSKCYEEAEYEESSPTGIRFKYLDYQMCILLDETEVRARLRFRDPVSNRHIYGLATIGYD